MTARPIGVSAKAASFTESVIREMTRLAIEHGAINLAQGFPDFPAPEAVKRAAQDAIEADVNQYAITWGAQGLPRGDRARSSSATLRGGRRPRAADLRHAAGRPKP